MHLKSWRPATILAFGALCAATAGLGWAISEAIVLDQLPEVEPRSGASLPSGVSRSVERSRDHLTLAVNQDPFHPERRRPSIAFRLPGEELPPTAATAPPGQVDLRLIGTAVRQGGGGFVMCKWGDESPRIVRLGERTRHLTLKRVEQGRAVFVSTAGERVELRVSKVSQ